jgi:alkylmercury lyase-like protein
MNVELRRRIFQQFAATGEPPEIAADELAALAREHAVVLDGQGRIAFANPFATSSAPYTVITPTRVRFAVCVWDGLGVAAALGEDARVEARCPDCHNQLCLEVRGGELVPTDTVVHFLVPAGQWYENLDST